MAVQPEANPPALYTAAEAAAILRVKTSWLERQAAARRIPFTMLGRSYRFTPAHLAVIVQLHEHRPRDYGDLALPPRRGGSTSSAVTAGEGSQLLVPRPSRRQHRRLGTEPGN